MNTLISGNGRKFAHYRNIELVYNTESSELTIISEDNKPTEHFLAEFLVIDDVLQLICDDENEPIFVRFKTKKELETFVNSINFEN